MNHLPVCRQAGFLGVDSIGLIAKYYDTEQKLLGRGNPVFVVISLDFSGF